MIDLPEAEKRVLAYLAESERKMNEFGSALPDRANREYLHLAISQIQEHDFGWVFCYNTKEYLNTNDFKYMLAGNSPLIVDKTDGFIYLTGTYRPVEFFIEQYRKGIRTRA